MQLNHLRLLVYETYCCYDCGVLWDQHRWQQGCFPEQGQRFVSPTHSQSFVYAHCCQQNIARTVLWLSDRLPIWDVVLIREVVWNIPMFYMTYMSWHFDKETFVVWFCFRSVEYGQWTHKASVVALDGRMWLPLLRLWVDSWIVDVVWRYPPLNVYWAPRACCQKEVQHEFQEADIIVCVVSWPCEQQQQHQQQHQQQQQQQQQQQHQQQQQQQQQQQHQQQRAVVIIGVFGPMQGHEP